MWNMKTVQREPPSIRKKDCLNVTFSTKNPTWNALISNPSLSNFFVETEVLTVI